ncbi:MAG: hypothetical protein ACK41Q_00525 [Candidatus Brocadia sp.]
MAVLPFYLPMFLPLDLRFIRALRLFRLFRILKMGRNSESLRMLGNVLSEKKGKYGKRTMSPHFGKGIDEPPGKLPGCK